MRQIIKIDILENYKLLFFFSDGLMVVFDVEPLLQYNLYASIRDYDVFKKVKFDGEHVYWNEVADLHVSQVLLRGYIVPEISRFYGLIISLYYGDTEYRHKPHIHVRYGDDNASFSIDDAEMLAGKLPLRQTRLIQAWIELHRDDILEDWDLIQNGKDYFTIAPLK